MTQDMLDIDYPSWEEWLSVRPRREPASVVRREVRIRFEANGHEWDIHGTIVSPLGAPQRHKFVVTHGGAGSETELLETPDDRPGLAVILASQGYRTLAVSFVGHFPRGGVWDVGVAERQPVYLLNEDLPVEEVLRRNLLCTFDVHVRGMAALVDHVFDGEPLIAFGHSTGGPMAAALPRFLTRNRVAGLVGWGSGEPNLWSREWTTWCAQEPPAPVPIDAIARRTPEWFEAAGYQDARDLCPWGGAYEYARWADRHKSQFKTSLCDNQHLAIVEAFPGYAAQTGLPIESYTDYLRDPDPEWLKRTSVLLLVGENDSRLWNTGSSKGARQIYVSERYALRARRVRTIVVPRLGHFGFVGRHNENIAYCWLEALETGFFG